MSRKHASSLSNTALRRQAKCVYVC